MPKRAKATPGKRIKSSQDETDLRGIFEKPRRAGMFKVPKAAVWPLAGPIEEVMEQERHFRTWFDEAVAKGAGAADEVRRPKTERAELARSAMFYLHDGRMSGSSTRKRYGS